VAASRALVDAGIDLRLDHAVTVEGAGVPATRDGVDVVFTIDAVAGTRSTWRIAE
jgi:hypothetical protein